LVKQIFNDAEDRMKKVIVSLKSDFATIRTGRASATILDKVFIDYYGTSTPINQVSSVSIPEPKMILIQPWDNSMLSAIGFRVDPQ
jgi:ribosome recycling factor